LVLGWVSTVPRVPRFSAAHRVREIGPTTRSFGAGRSPSQPQTLADEGLLNDATCWPALFVNLMTLPDVRPKYLVFGWSPKGTTVRVLVVYAFHADVMYESRYVALNRPAPAALPGASARSTVPSERV
jgi:hypothetical protein